jgi:hypothetical protein
MNTVAGTPLNSAIARIAGRRSVMRLAGHGNLRWRRMRGLGRSDKYGGTISDYNNGPFTGNPVIEMTCRANIIDV